MTEADGDGHADSASMRFVLDPAHDDCKAVTAQVKREMREEEAESDRVKLELLRDPTDGVETLKAIRREMPAWIAYARFGHLSKFIVRRPDVWPRLRQAGLLDTFVSSIINAPVGVRAEKVCFDVVLPSLSVDQPRWSRCLPIIGHILRTLLDSDDDEDRAAKDRVRARVPQIVKRLAKHRRVEMAGAHDMGIAVSTCTFLWSLQMSLFDGKHRRVTFSRTGLTLRGIAEVAPDVVVIAVHVQTVFAEMRSQTAARMLWTTVIGPKVMLGDGLVRQHASETYAKLLAIIPARLERCVRYIVPAKATIADAARLALTVELASSVIGHITLQVRLPPEPAPDCRFDAKLLLDAARLGFQLRHLVPTISNEEENVDSQLIEPIAECTRMALNVVTMHLYTTTTAASLADGAVGSLAWAEGAIAMHGLLEVAAVYVRGLIGGNEGGQGVGSMEEHTLAILVTFARAVPAYSPIVKAACQRKIPHLTRTILQPMFADKRLFYNIHPSFLDSLPCVLMMKWIDLIEAFELEVELHQPEPPACWARGCQATAWDAAARQSQCGGCRVALFCSKICARRCV